MYQALVQAQGKLPLIKADSALVDIRDGATFKKRDWRITPKARPDIYKTSSKNQKVTFYTDKDSISFYIEPGKKYDFVILYNGKDSAYTEIQYVPGVLDILKDGAKYAYSASGVHSSFPGAQAKAPELQYIRTKFRLDSVAGHGDEISRFINVLHWVHNSIHHDGSKDAPASTGTGDLMNKCIQGNLPLNCGALADILEDCYSSLGYKARRIICLPQDSTDFDCHSIDVVYSEKLKRWIWMDPTNDAYVMDENGELLGIAEVRDRLINDRPLKLNPDANWNHINKVTSDYYLYYYMAKNLYALEFFYTEKGVNKSLLLTPSNYKGLIPRTRGNHPDCTHNPQIFWSVPE